MDLYLDKAYNRRIALESFKYYIKIIIALCITYCLTMLYDPTGYTITGDFVEHYINKDGKIIKEIHTIVNDIYPAALCNTNNCQYHNFKKGYSYGIVNYDRKNGDMLQLTEAPTLLRMIIISVFIFTMFLATYALFYATRNIDLTIDPQEDIIYGG